MIFGVSFNFGTVTAYSDFSRKTIKTGMAFCHSRENIITHSEKALVNNIFSFFIVTFGFECDKVILIN